MIFCPGFTKFGGSGSVYDQTGSTSLVRISTTLCNLLTLNYAGTWPKKVTTPKFGKGLAIRI